MRICQHCGDFIKPGHACPKCIERIAKYPSDATDCFAWRDPETDPPTMTGRILVWISGIGPHLVNVSEMSCHFWDGQDDTEMTSPDEWDWWTEISPPNA